MDHSIWFTMLSARVEWEGGTSKVDGGWMRQVKGREGGRDGWRKGGREEGREGGRDRGRKGGREGGREERESGVGGIQGEQRDEWKKTGELKGGKEGGRERDIERGRVEGIFTHFRCLSNTCFGRSTCSPTGNMMKSSI